MNVQHCLCLCLLIATVLAQSNRKGKKKERKKSPQWKPDSMPAMKKQQVTVFQGETTTLDCSASGNPKPDIAWRKDGKKISKKFQDYKLELLEANTDMGGNYTCKISNKHGSMEWNFEVIVQVKLWPLLVEGPHNVTQVIGADVTFRCSVMNDPQATIRWQKVTGASEEDSSVELQNDSGDQHIYRIFNIQKEHEGMYRCLAGNVWGLKYSHAYLKVIENVIVPQLPPRPGFDVTTRDTSAKYDPSYSEPEDKFGMVDSYDSNNEPFFQTTRRSKNRNKDKEQKKKDKKKDKKGKDRMHNENDLNMYTTSSPTVQSTERGFPTSTMPVIWTYKDDLDYNGDSDKRLNVQKPDENEDRGGPVPTGNAKEADTNNYTGSISSWTIYTIVGAVGGVVLLIGLIAITLTVCCKRDEAGVYKSTPV